MISVIEKLTEFLNTLVMKYELLYKYWIKHGFVDGSLIILLSEYILSSYSKNVVVLLKS